MIELGLANDMSPWVGMVELTLTAEALLKCGADPGKGEDCLGREYRVGDVVLRPSIVGKAAFLCLVRVTKITATSITVGSLDGSGGVRLQRPNRALIVGKVK